MATKRSSRSPPTPARGYAAHALSLRGHGTSLATLIARLDAHAMLGHADHVERAATRLISPGTFVEPFALRALGVVRHDADLLTRAAARFHELALEWHARQTLLLLNS